MLSLNTPTMPIFPLNITKLSIFKRLDLPRATLVFVPERKEFVLSHWRSCYKKWRP